jgi:hypothetical protein
MLTMMSRAASSSSTGTCILVVIIAFFLYYKIVFYPTRLAEQRGVRNPLIGSANMMVRSPAEWLALLNYAAKAEPDDHAQARERATMAGAFGDAIDARMAPRGRPAPTAHRAGEAGKSHRIGYVPHAALSRHLTHLGSGYAARRNTGPS